MQSSLNSVHFSQQNGPFTNSKKQHFGTMKPQIESYRLISTGGYPKGGKWETERSNDVSKTEQNKTKGLLLKCSSSGDYNMLIEMFEAFFAHC